MPRLQRPSPALVISLIALFAAIGGSAYAAAQIGTNDIKDKAVKTAKLGSKAVVAGKIAPKAVKSGKISSQAVSNKKLANPIYWAYVDGDRVERGNGAEDVTHPEVGHWKVEFSDPIGECSYLATSAHLDSGREIAAAEDTANVVSVKIRTSNGTLTNSGSAFSLAVNC